MDEEYDVSCTTIALPLDAPRCDGTSRPAVTLATPLTLAGHCSGKPITSMRMHAMRATRRHGADCVRTGHWPYRVHSFGSPLGRRPEGPPHGPQRLLRRRECILEPHPGAWLTCLCLACRRLTSTALPEVPRHRSSRGAQPRQGPLVRRRPHPQVHPRVG